MSCLLEIAADWGQFRKNGEKNVWLMKKICREVFADCDKITNFAVSKRKWRGSSVG